MEFFCSPQMRRNKSLTKHSSLISILRQYIDTRRQGIEESYRTVLEKIYDSIKDICRDREKSYTIPLKKGLKLGDIPI